MNEKFKDTKRRVLKDQALNAILKYFPSISTVLVAWSYVPQIIMTYKTQDVSGQSTTFWVILSIALGMITVVQLALVIKAKEKNYGALIFQSINLILAVVMLVGVVLFK